MQVKIVALTLIAVLTLAAVQLATTNQTLRTERLDHLSTIERLGDEILVMQDQIDAAAVAEEQRAEAERAERLQYAEDGLIKLEDGPVAPVLRETIGGL